MESLANYASDDEIDASPPSRVTSHKDTIGCGMDGDNYDDVQMEMSENPLNGSKDPSVQAYSLGCSGGAPPTCATNNLDSSSESGNRDGNRNDSPRKSNQESGSSSPSSAASSEEGSEERLKTSRPEETELAANCDKNDVRADKEKAQTERDLENRRERVKEREKERDRGDKDREKERIRDRDREREKERDRGRERDDRDRRKDVKKDDRHRSRSRDRRERRRSPERNDRRRSRERDELRRSRDRRSSSREHRRRDSDRRRSDANRRESDNKKRQRSRSRSAERHKPGTDSRSSSSSASSKGSKDGKSLPSGPSRGSRSRSKSMDKERPRVSGGDSRKFYLEKKIDRKMNVLERMGIELKAEAKSSVGMVTPQMLVQRTMEQEAAQVKQATGVELPSYYNAAAVNPQRLVDQIQKRKLLWGSKKDDQSKPASQQQPLNKWQGATFAQDQDGKLTAKFNRLMGIKQPMEVPSAPGKEAPGSGSEIIKKQEEMFHNMESQYEVARLATHTHRGLGLGFGTFQPR